ncbi:ATP-binding protein [Actinoallomurus soli]|uniref:ATP-binding protein n=1 Tax=Actinoallomurus soli TaxID=2952535 RepID=UPI0020931A63|nr:LuxR C-terminal-related transcriptional regulator [Actinoallomurus soli]MCO5967250.1 LuxR C-terminal-related transcriptional regulator [Actinoallomurus soli]
MTDHDADGQPDTCDPPATQVIAEAPGRSARRHSGVPDDLTPLFGRRAEVTAVRRLLTASRLVTLTGPGGVGKTRVALRAAAALGRHLPDGAHVVELARLRDPQLLPQCVAAALGLADRTGRDPLEAVVDHVQPRRLLLVLDNCEHLVGACAPAVETLLRAAPGVRVLTTSRQVLRVPGEQVFQVGPLPTPTPGERKSVGELLRNPSVALFEQRAAAVLPGFAVTRDNAEAVIRLVCHLDGLPLAIELASAWMRTLSVQEILAKLTDRFALLTSRSTTSAPRQHTLRELVDWSHALCTDQERALWARASVFASGFDLEAAEAVCSGDGIPVRAVVEVVDGLVGKSVLTREEHDGRARYRMLETIREYGHARLVESGKLTVLRRRHRDHFLDLTSRAQDQWFGPHQVAWFVRLRLEHANLQAALRFCLDEPGEAAAGLALAVAPRHYWISFGSLSEGRYWLSRLLSAADTAKAPVERAPETGGVLASALGTYAYLGVLQGRTVEARPLLEQARADAESSRDVAALAWTRHHAAMIAVFHDDFAGAATLFEQALTAFRALSDTGAAAECTFKLALSLAAGGDHERAAALCCEAEEVTAAHDESWIRGLTAFARSLSSWWRGDTGIADRLARDAIRLIRPFQDWWDIAMCAEILAWRAAEDDPDRAAQLFGILHSLWQSVGGTFFAAPFMADLHGQCERKIRSALAPKAFERAFQRGARLPVHDALDYVLQEPSADRPDTAMGGLTRREREVSALVAAGLSNKEVAARLVIAQRTAENHVERILAKLGFTSRAQLAVWAAEQSPSAP